MREITSITNRTDEDIPLYLEPEGHHFTIRPGKQIIVVATDSPDGRLDIDIEPEGISVWSWRGAILDIYQDGSKMVTDQGYIPYE